MQDGSERQVNHDTTPIGEVKAEAPKIYLAKNAAAARRAFERFRFHWRSRYPVMVRQLERDLSELLHFFHHECDRALLRGSTAADAAHGRVHQRGKRGSDHLRDL